MSDAAYETRPDTGDRERPPARAGKERRRPPITGDTTPVGAAPVSVAAIAPRYGRFASNDLRYRDSAHPDNTQFTPSYVLDLVRVDLGGTISLDPCTTDDNPVGAERFYAPPKDGLTEPWDAATIFVNPPYAKAREPWVKKCVHMGFFHGRKVILLIPAATDTRIWQEAAMTADAIVFVRGRLKFGVLRPNRRQVAASHPSSLIGWNTSLDACSELGFAPRWWVPRA